MILTNVKRKPIPKYAQCLTMNHCVDYKRFVVLSGFTKTRDVVHLPTTLQTYLKCLLEFCVLY